MIFADDENFLRQIIQSSTPNKFSPVFFKKYYLLSSNAVCFYSKCLKNPHGQKYLKWRFYLFSSLKKLDKLKLKFTTRQKVIHFANKLLVVML